MKRNPDWDALDYKIDLCWICLGLLIDLLWMFDRFVIDLTVYSSQFTVHSSQFTVTTTVDCMFHYHRQSTLSFACIALSCSSYACSVLRRVAGRGYHPAG